MQAKVQEKNRAILLRKQGFSYAEIMQVVPVAQASLSLWLRDIALTGEQKQRLKNISQGAGAQARRDQRLGLERILVQEIGKEISKLMKDSFFLFGLALYWAEGNKQKPWNISTGVGFSNSDERTVLIMRNWLMRFGNIHPKDFTYSLHIHETADIEKAKLMWAEILSIKKEKLRIAVKRNIVRSRHKNIDYKGLIQLRVYKSTWLNRRIELWTKHTAEFYLQP